MERAPSLSAVLATKDVVLSRSGKSFAKLPDLQLAAGETLAIVGASGSGKTTALMALAGIRAPAQGDIVIERTDLWKLGRRDRDRFRGRRIGLVFQSFHLIDALAVGANLTLAARCAGVRPNPERLDHLLDKLGIADLRKQRADRISHGQAQRVAVARALFNKPAVVLADEPTSALDDGATTALLALLKEAAASEGAGLVVATHDRRVLDSVDRAVEMERAS
jgi:putative ABC transport system ATP-binding protein